MRRMPLLVFAIATSALAQHDISKVEPAPPGAAIATPLPEVQKRQMRKYDIPDMAGAKQALGSQLIDGRLPRPLVDYISRDGVVEQRISLFEGGLVVINMTGAATIRKKVIIPPDALKSYLGVLNAAALRRVDPGDLMPPDAVRIARLRVYDADGIAVERVYNPIAVLPKVLADKVLPMQDLLRAISEDRTVTTSVAGYEPKAGDELVADDQRVFRVVRVTEPGGVVELKCLDDPTTMYIARKDLSQYFVGRR
jgi:hypothetical protein